jgi:preprotein translocase subunit SecA
MSEMDRLLDGIHLRAHAQVDPLVAWQREGYTMFEAMLEHVDADYARYVLNVREVVQPTPAVDLDRAVTNAAVVEETPSLATRTGTGTGTTSSALTWSGSSPKAPGATKTKIGRNDPCHCGSGKKFKQCHGRP